MDEERRFSNRRRIKLTPLMQDNIKAEVRDDLSLKQVTSVMCRQGEATVSHERIYQHIYAVHRRVCVCVCVCRGERPLQAPAPVPKEAQKATRTTGSARKNTAPRQH